jgi:hypothetical protein
MTRTLALACAIKGGREIAIIGHTDCKVRQTSVLELTERFRHLGIPRDQLPDNLQDFFGLFASERQNVIRGAEFVRQSQLIGSQVPVHGLLIDVQTGKLEWVVDGYEVLERHRTAPAESHPALPELDTGAMKWPDFKIGDMVMPTELARPQETHTEAPRQQSHEQRTRAEPAEAARLNPETVFRVVGEDKKIYGPVTGRDLQQWIREGRISWKSLAQKLGYKDWKQLSLHVEGEPDLNIPIPPPLEPALKLLNRKPKRRE